ncbi:MAG TPA: ATP-binding cassette domain-containing protein, partial [Actinomycetota bacterium]|nr:ATP-binding cassette domain-containing protein [Actinomycetota bacterium]
MATTPQGDGALLVLQGVRKAFGSNVVLDGIDLTVGAGEAVVIAGPSGSGKSTLLRCVNGLESVDGGDIRFAGRSIPNAGREIYRLRSEIGMV